MQRFKRAHFTLGDSAEMPPHLVNATEVTAEVVNSDLMQLARDFPSYAKFLRHEFDNRCAGRLLTDMRHTLGEKIRRLITKVASKPRSPDIKLMALYIPEKMAGGPGSRALGAGQVAQQLELPENKDAVDALKGCQ